MLGLLLLYWIGKYYYQLAEKYNRNHWGFAILGIITYYFGVMLFGLIIGVIVEIIAPGYIENMNDIALNFIIMPFGILSTYSLYKLIENRWKDKYSFQQPDNKIEIE
ncbi:hypothetical protein NE848_04160 [Gramella jeungdoensis]|uniref:Uncharacterized protein n=1 Tax=Gramella jeungdoensis TaxID=708091 RepID=A0ABT0YZI5_9FLAO|nr:hypothetical protein [Gramella jeungdoensis]MCM8568558.1 hypothetical protein [Gramella jeungdoensis]